VLKCAPCFVSLFASAAPSPRGPTPQIPRSERLAFAVTSLVQFVVFLRWIYRRIRNDELTRAFVEDMATNHLPHIYEMLEKLCDKQGIERDQVPTIRWIDLNDRSN
jgi:hypothetical protein